VPPGTVPIRRVALSQLAQAGSLEFQFRKGPPSIRDSRPDFRRVVPIDPASAGGGDVVVPAGAIIPERHLHAGFQFGPYQQSGVISGVSSYLNVWNPNPSPGAMSLSQQWILSNAPTSTGYPQTVEAGWQVCPSNYPFSSNAVLFVFFNPDGYNPQNSGYVYNQHMEGFIGATGASWAPGVAMGQFSTLAGPQFSVLMVWTRDNQGDWNLYMGTSQSDLSAVGYFPGAYYSKGLANGADYIQFGGEVASLRGSTATGPMGSGTMPASPSLTNFGNMAFQYQLQFQPTGGSSFLNVDDGAMVPIAEVPQSYLAVFGTDPSWGKYFFFGGASAI
jgi:hypothetical protein